MFSTIKGQREIERVIVIFNYRRMQAKQRHCRFIWSLSAPMPMLFRIYLHISNTRDENINSSGSGLSLLVPKQNTHRAPKPNGRRVFRTTERGKVDHESHIRI